MRWVPVLLLPIIAGCSALGVGPFPRTIIPAEIAAPQNQRLELVLAAVGAQSYRCDSKVDAPGRPDWVMQETEARLRDVGGTYFGRHFAGTTWEANDGSKVVGIVQASVAAPGRTGIPWLRFGAKSSGGAGLLANVNTVLLVSTVGGLPPGGGCTELDRGRILRVDYNADYYFYVPR